MADAILKASNGLIEDIKSIIDGKVSNVDKLRGNLEKTIELIFEEAEKVVIRSSVDLYRKADKIIVAVNPQTVGEFSYSEEDGAIVLRNVEGGSSKIRRIRARIKAPLSFVLKKCIGAITRRPVYDIKGLKVITGSDETPHINFNRIWKERDKDSVLKYIYQWNFGDIDFDNPTKEDYRLSFKRYAELMLAPILQEVNTEQCNEFIDVFFEDWFSNARNRKGACEHVDILVNGAYAKKLSKTLSSNKIGKEKIERVLANFAKLMPERDNRKKRDKLYEIVLRETSTIAEARMIMGEYFSWYGKSRWKDLKDKYSSMCNSFNPGLSIGEICESYIKELSKKTFSKKDSKTGKNEGLFEDYFIPLYKQLFEKVNIAECRNLATLIDGGLIGSVMPIGSITCNYRGDPKNVVYIGKQFVVTKDNLMSVTCYHWNDLANAKRFFKENVRNSLPVRISYEISPEITSIEMVSEKDEQSILAINNNCVYIISLSGKDTEKNNFTSDATKYLEAIVKKINSEKDLASSENRAEEEKIVDCLMGELEKPAGWFIEDDAPEFYDLIKHQLYIKPTLKCKDNIAHPKKNGYQALKFRLNDGLEVQIMTCLMHWVETYGTAAHGEHYKKKQIDDMKKDINSTFDTNKDTAKKILQYVGIAEGVIRKNYLIRIKKQIESIKDATELSQIEKEVYILKDWFDKFKREYEPQEAADIQREIELIPLEVAKKGGDVKTIAALYSKLSKAGYEPVEVTR